MVAERESGGPYADVDALVRARGVGPSTVEALRPFVTAGN
ncbi:MAG: helix-hairpin-helix domain-containing protein [bacterium]